MSRRSELVIAALLAALTACGKDRIKVLDPETTEGGDFGRAALLEAVDKFRETPTSPEAYRALARRAGELEETAFDESNEELADRLMAFLALGPMEATYDRPGSEQVEILGATVWPTVLGPAPKEGEGGRAYLDRVCADELAGECKYIAPEMRGLFMGAKVWRRFRQRAQETFSTCLPCQNDDSYRKALRRYDELSFPLESEAAERKGDGHPGAWPRGGESAKPWSEALTLEVSGSAHMRLDGREVDAKKWRETLSRRHDAEAIGLYLRPGTSIALARNFISDLASLGYAEIRLQVRAPDYPWELGYYSLAPSPRTRRAAVIGLRGTDTVQVGVLAMEQAAARGETPASIF
jgi:hypothetical protein